MTTTKAPHRVVRSFATALHDRVRDVTSVIYELNHVHEVRLHLDEARRELLLPREQAAALPAELKAAIKHHRVALLKRTLFLDTLERFDAWMVERAGADRDAEPHTMGRRALGSVGTADRLNYAWSEGGVDAFEEVLSAYMRAGAHAFLAAVRSVEGPEPAEPLLNPIP